MPKERVIWEGEHKNGIRAVAIRHSSTYWEVQMSFRGQGCNARASYLRQAWAMALAGIKVAW